MILLVNGSDFSRMLFQFLSFLGSVQRGSIGYPDASILLGFTILEEVWLETAQAGCAGYSAEAELKRWAWLTATPTSLKTLVLRIANHLYVK